MSEARETPLPSAPVHWWGTGVARFGLLLLALTALLLVPIHLTQTSALVVGIGGLALLALPAFHPGSGAVGLCGRHHALQRRLRRARRLPLLGDFVYNAVNLAFANPPPDVVAESRTAHAAATVEIVAAAGFLAAYLGAFLAGRRLTAGSRPPDSA